MPSSSCAGFATEDSECLFEDLYFNLEAVPVNWSLMTNTETVQSSTEESNVPKNHYWCDSTKGEEKNKTIK